MVNRSDAYTVLGGDTLQMIKTAETLERLGVSVDTALADDLAACDWRYDIVHVFNIQTAEESLWAAKEAKRRQIPVVLSPIYWDPLPGWFRDAYGGSPIWGALSNGVGRRAAYWIYETWQRRNYPKARIWQQQRELLRMADWLLPNSRAELGQLMADFRLPRGMTCRASIVVNGIDRALYHERPLPSDKWREVVGDGFVLEVGRISPEKNTLALIEALWDTDVQLVFVGKPSPYSPEYAQTCVDRARERGKVHFLGFVPYAELPGLYALAAVHALPSWRETPGLVSLEAAAAGCRIVSTNIGSAHEYFGDAVCYCDPSNVNSIREAVSQALAAPTTPDLRERVLGQYTWDHAAESTLRAYSEVAHT
jgi:glycosyltransferase involved in cell wall biosynthesis